jgi:hypothetical protein
MKAWTILGLTVMAFATACASAPSDARFAAYRFDASRDHVGRIYHYLRTNRDGSLPEHIRVYRKSWTQIEIYKMVRRCTNAALVTADLSFDYWSATRLVGGRLGQDGTQQAFAVMTLDPARPRVDAVVTLPDQQLRQSLDLKSLPWRLYDFDFAEFTIFTQHLRDYRKGFAVETALVLTDPGDPQFLKRLGEARAAPLGLDEDRGVYRYRLEGEAFAAGGTLVLDAQDGHVVEVETAVPNHLEYDDFKLVLQSVSDGGEADWRKLLSAHYEDCEAAT